jgi:hypothetical protein
VAPHLKLLHEPSDAELLTAERENAQGECPHNLDLKRLPAVEAGEMVPVIMPAVATHSRGPVQTIPGGLPGGDR